MIRTQLVRRASALLLAALVVQAGGLPYFVRTAHAADGPTVVLLPFVQGQGAPDKAHARFRELLETELKGRDSLSVARLPDTGSAAAKPSGKPSAEALQALESGQAKLGELEFDAAAADLKKGIALLTKNPEAIDFQKLLEANISLAVALFRMGDEDAAQSALLTVVRLAPEYRLADGKFPPIFVREFDKARRRTEKSVKGTLVVDGPPGATAFIDGKDLGMVPVTQENLAAGTHYVKVEGTRGELFGQTAEVKSGTSRVKGSFASSAGDPAISAVGPVLDAAALELAGRACQASGANFAVVGVVYRSGEHQLTAATALYSARHKAFVTQSTRAFDHELLTANVEAFKLADEIADQVDAFPRGVALPRNLAEGAGYKATTIARTGTEEVRVAEGGSRRVLVKSDKPTLVPEEEVADEEERVRAFQHASVQGEVGGAPDGARGEVKTGGPAWWVWTLVGVGVVAAAGGTYYGVSQATRPVTGTVTAKW